MQKRSVAAVIILSIITLGIYTIVWFVKTKNEMNTAGAGIPSAWWIIVPIANIWWLWKYSEGVELVSRKDMSGPVAFLLLILLEIIGIAVVQVTLNKVVDRGTLPQATAM